MPQHQQRFPGSARLRTTTDFFAMKKLLRFCLNDKQRKRNWTANGPSKDRSTKLPRAKKKSPQNQTQDRRQDGPGQTSPPQKRKGQLEKEISKTDRKTSKKKRQDLRSTPERGESRKSRGKEERSEQSTKKKPPKRHKHTKTNQIQAKGKKRKAKIKIKVTEEKAQRKSPKLAQPDSKDGKEKPRRNKEMEGQRVRTINPSREKRDANATTPNYQQTLEVERKETQVTWTTKQL